MGILFIECRDSKNFKIINKNQPPAKAAVIGIPTCSMKLNISPTIMSYLRFLKLVSVFAQSNLHFKTEIY